MPCADGIVNDIESIGSLRSWRMLFWVEGVRSLSPVRYLRLRSIQLVTCCVGIFTFFLLTDRPETARWLSHEEKALASVRIKSESVGTTHHLEAINKASLLFTERRTYAHDAQATVWSGVRSLNAWMLGVMCVQLWLLLMFSHQRTASCSTL